MVCIRTTKFKIAHFIFPTERLQMFTDRSLLCLNYSVLCQNFSA